MKKIIFPVACGILMLIFTLSGCGTTQSRIVAYEKNNEKLSIHAVGETGNFSTKITLYVNGQVVATGETTTFKSVANLSGMYKNFKIEADCKSVAVGSLLHRECTIYVDSEKAAELAF